MQGSIPLKVFRHRRLIEKSHTCSESVDEVLSTDASEFSVCKEILVETGYSDVTNVGGGFGGARDPSGQLLIPGWIDSGLPICTEVDEAHSYTGLKQRTGL